MQGNYTETENGVKKPMSRRTHHTRRVQHAAKRHITCPKGQISLWPQQNRCFAEATWHA